MTKKELVDRLSKYPDDFEVAFVFNGCTQSGELLGITEVTDFSESVCEECSKKPEDEKIVVLYCDRERLDTEFPPDSPEDPPED